MTFLLGMSFFVSAQQVSISGRICDQNNEGISNAVVTVIRSSQDVEIMAYDHSDSEGKFSLMLDAQKAGDSVWVVVKHLAFEPLKIRLAAKTATRVFKLSPRTEVLDEVILKSKQTFSVRGDTLTYAVNGLKRGKDISIEDVISRIPGVSISENGQIRYFDKPISHLYVNGLDLLQGRYSIATRGIPADAVKEIDVLKNHNHERIAIGRKSSEAVAMNLKINEDEGVFFGSATIAAGTPVLTRQIEGTPIVFRNNFQNISLIKHNNIGISYRDLNDNLISESSALVNYDSDETRIVRQPLLMGSGVSEKYWLNNDSYAASNDALHRIGDSTMVKWNVSYINDLGRIRSGSSTIFTGEDFSQTVENDYNTKLRTQVLSANVQQEVNKRNLFLKNTSNLSLNNEDGNENVLLNGNPINSDYEFQNFKFSNGSDFKIHLGRSKILQVGLLFSYLQSTEQLEVQPDVFSEVIPSVTPAENTTQTFKLSNLNAAMSGGLNFSLKKMEIEVTQNLRYRSDNLSGGLYRGMVAPQAQFPFFGDLDYRQFSSSSSVKSRLKFGKFNTVALMVVDYESFAVNENLSPDLAIRNNFLFFQPNLSLNYRVNRNWTSTSRYSRTNQLSRLPDMLPSYVLVNYNTVVQNQLFINQVATDALSHSLDYFNLLTNFSFSFAGIWNQSRSDILLSSQIDSQGFLLTEINRARNTTLSRGVRASIGKTLFSKLKGQLSYDFTAIESNLIFNGDFVRALSNRNTITAEMYWDYRDKIGLDYELQASFNTSRLPSTEIQNRMFFHKVGMDVYVSEKLRVNGSLESAIALIVGQDRANRNTIANLSCFYKPSKKLSANISAINLFDVRTFTTTFAMANTVSVSNFFLRPRQITAGLTYAF